MLFSADLELNTRFRPSNLSAVVLMLLMSACTTGLGSYFAPTAAVVNGEKIPEADLTRELRNYRSQISNLPQFAPLFEGKDAAANRREQERQILTRLIQRLVLADAAERLGVDVSNEDVDRQIKLITEQVKAGGQDFEKLLAQQHLSLGQLKNFVRLQALIEKVGEKIGSDTEVPEDQMRAFYDQNKATFDAQVQIAHVQVCENFDESAGRCVHTPEDQSLASNIAARARAGEDFAALAKEFSKDASTAGDGGVVGWIGPTGGTAFEQAALTLAAPGQISDPIQTTSGWHVIKLLAKGRPLEASRDEIHRQLVQPLLQEAYQKFLEEELDKARIRINPKYGRFDGDSHEVVAREPARARG